MIYPGEHEEYVNKNDEFGSEISEDDMLHGLHDAEQKDEASHDPSETADPPDWLVETIGLGSQAERPSGLSEQEPAEDIPNEGTEGEGPLGGVVFPDWLENQAGAPELQPFTDSEPDRSEDIEAIETRTTSSIDAGIDPESHTHAGGGDIEFPTQLVEESETMEDAMNGVLEDPSFNQDEEPDELEDELKWLEELAASHDPSEEGSSGIDGEWDALIPLPEEDYIPDWLKEDVLDDALQEEHRSAYVSVSEGAGEISPTTDEQAGPDDELPDWLREQMVDEALSQQEEEADDIDWFSLIVSGDEAALDELLAFEGISLVSEEDVPAAEKTSDQLSWLEELDQFAESGEETIVSEPIVEDSFFQVDESEVEDWEQIETVEQVDDISETSPEDVPTDPEEAMAWLEQLALEQSAAGGEFSSEIDFQLSDEASDGAEPGDVGDIEKHVDLTTEVPEDPDEAMAWLEQLAAEQGAPDDALWTFEADETAAAIEIVPDLADDELETALAVLSEVAMPADQDEALSWLEELATAAELEPEYIGAAKDFDAVALDEFDAGFDFDDSDFIDAQDEKAAFAADATQEVEELQIAALAAAAEILDLEIDDEAPPEAAPGLAAPGSTDETIPGILMAGSAVVPEDEASSSEVDDVEGTDVIDETTPDFLDKEEEAILDDELVDSDESPSIDETIPGTLMSEAVVVLDDESDESAGHGSIEETIVGTLIAAAAIVDEGSGEVSGEDVELESIDSAPVEPLFDPGIEVEDDSLAEAVDLVDAELEDEDEETGDDLEWLDDLDEANVTGWLMAEQALLAEEKTLADDRSFPPADEYHEAEIERSDTVSTQVQHFKNYQFDDHGLAKLATAQAALQKGQLAEAHAAYSKLVDSSESLPYVIADLELVVESTEDQANFMKLLGDAYSRNGQLQKAIEIYRLALDNL